MAHHQDGVLEWSVTIGVQITSWFCHVAAAANNASRLMWARDRGVPWDARCYTAAIVEGHVDLLKVGLPCYAN